MRPRSTASRRHVSAAAAALVGFVGLIAFAAPASSAALAALTGGGTSGVLSSNSKVRQQQLTCDPTGTLLSGMDSVKYDPSVVALTGLDFAPGFTGSAAVEVRGQVSVKLSNGCWGKAVKTFLQPLTSFLTCPQGQETGYVQVYYKSAGTPQPICVKPGFTELDAAGVKGTDTHDLMFNYRACVNSATLANYTIYADPGNRISGNGTDFLTAVSNGKVFTLCPSQIAPASVSASLVAGPKKQGKGRQGRRGGGRRSFHGRARADLLRAGVAGGTAGANAVPLPPAAWTGLAMLAGLGLLARLRRSALV